ncbi:Fc.00g054570.m01.CDS01 [Cosmosporella sp. VM-42]
MPGLDAPQRPRGSRRETQAQWFARMEHLDPETHEFQLLAEQIDDEPRGKETLLSEEPRTVIQAAQNIPWILPSQVESSFQYPPNYAQVFNVFTLCMRKYLQTHILGRRIKKAKPQLGVAEICQLMDMDMATTPCIDLAEGMHISWLLGRQCALRPGSIGVQRIEKATISETNAPYLAWKDVKITRGTRPGVFDLEITIRNLKGSKVDYAEGGQAPENREVTFYLKSPTQPDNLALSLPHRLLVAALKREAIEGIETLEGLLDGNVHRIRFKQEFLNRPVVLRGGERGLSVIKDQPATVATLTEYLQRRCERMGYPESVTFYAIRRRAATDFTAIFGPDIARAIMNHDADTRTMERHYLDFFRTTNLTAAALGEDAPEQEAEMTMNANYLTLNRLNPQRVAHLYGPQLNAAVRKLLVGDDIYAAAETSQERKNRERVLRRSALRSLMEMAHNEREGTMTVEEMAERREEILEKMSLFNHRLLELTREIANSELANAAIHGVDCDGEFLELDARDDDAEPDFDEEEHRGNHVHVEEELFVSREALQDVDYFEAVRYTMGILLENALSSYAKKYAAPCPLCSDDPTCTLEQKEKLWKPNHIVRHLQSYFHADFGAFQRRATRKKESDGLPGFICEICVAIFPADWEPVYYKGFNELSRHVAESTSGTIKRMQNKPYPPGSDEKELATRHDALKTEMGWYRDDFKGDQVVHQKEKQERATRIHRTQALERTAFAFTEEPELDAPVPVRGQKGIVYGSWQALDQNIPAHMESQIRLCPIPGLQILGNTDDATQGQAEEPTLPDYLRLHLRLGPLPWGRGPMACAEIPPHQTVGIKVVPVPGAEGNKEKNRLWLKHRLPKKDK